MSASHVKRSPDIFCASEQGVVIDHDCRFRDYVKNILKCFHPDVFTLNGVLFAVVGPRLQMRRENKRYISIMEHDEDSQKYSTRSV